MTTWIPLSLIIGGTCWSVILGVGIVAYSLIQNLKHKRHDKFAIATYMFLTAVIFIVLGTILGCVLKSNPWVDVRAILSQTIDPYIPFGTQHGDLSIRDIFQPREGVGSPDMTKEDWDAFMAHLKSVPPLPPHHTTPTLQGSFRVRGSKTPYLGIVSVPQTPGSSI